MPDFGPNGLYIYLAYAATVFFIVLLFFTSYFSEKKIESQTKK